jgi:hypothetical protein
MPIWNLPCPLSVSRATSRGQARTGHSLHRIAKRPDGKRLGRKDFTRPLTPIRKLRNRVAHHEPIISWSLRKHHDRMLELTEWLAPAACAWCRQLDRFDEVYPAEGIVLAHVQQDEAEG